MTEIVEKMQSDSTEQESAPVCKKKRKSKTLWFNGVMGSLSMVIAGAEFFTGFIKEIAPTWVYMLLLVICGLNNAANWYLRTVTSEPIK